jgi:ATP-dependent DNA helicase PIF1
MTLGDIDENQQAVVQALLNNENVLMSGIAGSGKSFLIQNLRHFLPGKKVYITSTSGVSALNIGGTTLHSWVGIGLGKESKEKLVRKIKFYKNVKKRICDVDTLVIDEISMLGSDLLDKINYILQSIRWSSKPFGGVQMLFSGDFLQLEPVEGDNVLSNKLIKDFKVINLRHNYRQASDTEFQEILNNLRINKLTDENIRLLESRITDVVPENITRLFCINREVATANKNYSNSIPAGEVTYKAKFTGSKVYVEQLKAQFTNRGIDTLKLKNGMRVMLTRNLDPGAGAGLVNGSCGLVIRCGCDSVTVKFDNGRTETVVAVSWELYDYEECVARATQIPLIIGYAASIHKCQGLTLDAAYIDLSRAFCDHQVYVALSRVKTLDGVHLKNFNVKKIKINEDSLQFFENLSLNSD